MVWCSCLGEDLRTLFTLKNLHLQASRVARLQDSQESTKELKKIIQKFWPLLFADEIISKYIQPYPQITYRKSRSLKDQLVHSHLKTTTSGGNHRGTAPCGRCEFCRFLTNSTEILLPSGGSFGPNFFVNCRSIGVVYIMKCECKAFYVGKKRGKFFHRIRDHVSPGLNESISFKPFL